MNEQYLTILTDSLKKKCDILNEILRLSKRQSEMLAAEPIDFEGFDACVDDKDICIEQINKLDENFETVYRHVAEVLKDNKAQYASWIAECQGLIAKVTSKGMEIESLEARNKKAVEAAFKKERRAIGQGKRSAEVARNYYRNMKSPEVLPPQYMDKKK